MKVTKLTRDQLKGGYEVKMDEVIEIDGKQYKAEEDCTACPFFENQSMCGNLICTRTHRKDGKSVHFVEVRI